MLYYIILIIFFTFIVIFTRKCYKYIRFRKIDNTDNESEANKMGEIKAVNIPIKADIKDVADWFLLKENMSNKKIQKLCYYAEAWSLVLLDQDISQNSDFEAWVHGPVSKTLYNEFKGFGWQELTITNPVVVKKRLDELFTKEQIEVLESVWDTYGEYGADQLEALTHTEKPWLEQRKGLGKFQSSTRKISKETMKRYYKSIAI
ncbi:hypothetical protein B5E92_06385 [Erysipelatoclostridium sp. An15]|nr:hypothetical protein B5F09_06965 [Erysipelatoclostridium sp. An173]OUQ07838.1 hypothetical protein B5E92_06385 [Erysipelatoclostridium sp. An15]